MPLTGATYLGKATAVIPALAVMLLMHSQMAGFSTVPTSGLIRRWVRPLNNLALPSPGALSSGEA